MLLAESLVEDFVQFPLVVLRQHRLRSLLVLVARLHFVVFRYLQKALPQFSCLLVAVFQLFKFIQVVEFLAFKKVGASGEDPGL